MLRTSTAVFTALFAVLLNFSAGAMPGGHFAAQRSSTTGPVLKVRVICETVQTPSGPVTYSCPDGKICNFQTRTCDPPAQPAAKPQPAPVSRAKPAAKPQPEPVSRAEPKGKPEPIACSVCAANQKRDSDACSQSGDLLAQSACINRVNAEWQRCNAGCK